MFGVGIQELLIIFFIILLFFGSKKLPELSKSLGQAIKEFKDALTDTSSTKDEKKKRS